MNDIQSNYSSPRTCCPAKPPAQTGYPSMGQLPIYILSMTSQWYQMSSWLVWFGYSVCGPSQILR